MQIDHVQADDGEYLYGHARCAGVPVGQHFGVCVQGTAVETETRKCETENAIFQALSASDMLVKFYKLTNNIDSSDLRIFMSLQKTQTIDSLRCCDLN